MFVLKKVFQLRDKANPEHEKPFLDHLEDLRIMITKTVVTLLIAMVVCFAYQDKLMEVIREPVDKVWLDHEEALLPDDVSGAEWEHAKKIERAAVALDPELSKDLLDQFDEGTRALVGIVQLLRAVAVLPEEKRDDFLTRAKADTPRAATVMTMLEKGASPDIDTRGNLQMMSTLNPTEGFMLSMKLAFFAGVVVSFPLLLMYILQFVLPGLHQHETKVLWPALAIGFGLFLGGVFFAYFVVLPRALTFFHDWSLSMGVSNDWRIGYYITFATQFTLLFGLSFELPVIVMVFVKLGLLTYEAMSRTRAYAILAIVVVAAIITPTPDAFTLCLMALPMILLYEICIWLAYFDARKQRRKEDEESRERMERLLMEEEESGEEEDRGDDWDPSASEEGWKAGEEANRPDDDHDHGEPREKPSDDVHPDDLPDR